MKKVVRSAPRYDPRIVALLRELDDRSEPIAEICRRVAAEAEHLGLTRPSPVHLRALLSDVRAAEDAARERGEERLDVTLEVLADWMLQRSGNAYEDALRIDEARRRASD